MAGVVCCRLGGGGGSLLCEMGRISKESDAVAEIGLLGISVAGLAMFCIFSVGDYQLTPWFVISNLIPIYILVRIIHLLPTP